MPLQDTVNFHNEYFGKVRHELLSMFPNSASAILDVGCGTGATTIEAGRNTGATRLVGIEIMPEPASEARKYLNEVVVGNIEDMPSDYFKLGEFDVILCADVLEHLTDPWAALRKLCGWLSNDGVIIASIPNMAHLTVLLKLVFDRLEYEDEGVLDRTHLKFFTLHTIRQLFGSAGLTLERIESNRSHTLKFRLLDLLTFPLGSKFSIYQYRITARKKNS